MIKRRGEKRERKGREKSGKATKLGKLQKAESDKMEMVNFTGKGVEKKENENKRCDEPFLKRT